MNKLKQLFFVPFAIFCLLILGGCMAPQLALLVPRVGASVDAHTTDSFLATIRLKTPVTGDAFIEDMKKIAERTHCHLVGVHGRGMTERSVTMRKQVSDPGGALIGRSLQYTVTLNLEGDGGDVQINASITGNNHKADSGSAKELVDEYKKIIIAYYQ